MMQTLNRIRKGLDPARMSDAIRLTQAAGINVELFTLFGLPGETRENAIKTLEYVNRHGVDIEGNSISQQLHLFFGTPISDNPSAHGVQPLPVTRPAYQSICRDFATDCMSGDEIRQMSLLWRINRKDFEEDIENGCNLFRIAGLITAHKQCLHGVPRRIFFLPPYTGTWTRLKRRRPACSACMRSFPITRASSRYSTRLLLPTNQTSGRGRPRLPDNL